MVSALRVLWARVAPSARALRRSGRRLVARPHAVDCGAARVLPAGPRAEQRLPGQVRGRIAGAARGRQTGVPRQPGSLRQRRPRSPRCSRTLFRDDWVVYAKRPFGGAEHALRYLGRYTHRVAISNHRLIALEDGEVCSAGATRPTAISRSQ